MKSNAESKRKRAWRIALRAHLIAQLGDKCADCGVPSSEKKLVFGHITPLTIEQHEHRVAIGANARMSLYRREIEEGLIKCLCQSCNIKQSFKERKPSEPTFL